MTEALSAMAEATSYIMVWMAFNTAVRMSARLGGVLILYPEQFLSMEPYIDGRYGNPSDN